MKLNDELLLKLLLEYVTEPARQHAKPLHTYIWYSYFTLALMMQINPVIWCNIEIHGLFFI